MVKLIVLDLDGTLVKHKNKVSKENIKALQKARNKGIKICIATGRHISRVEMIAKQIGIDKAGEYVICLNGGSIYKYQNEKLVLIDEKLFSVEECKFIFDYSKEYKINCFGYAQNYKIAYVTKKSLFSWILKKVSHRKLVKYNQFKFNEQIYKIIAFGSHERINSLRNHLKERDFEMFSWSYISNTSNIEINPKGVDKLFSLQVVAKEYGIDPKNIVYFGDGDNDKRAMQWVEHSVAMENARDEVLDIAKSITTSNKKSGIAKYLNNNLLID